jgi:hypothetical protein
MTSPLLALFIRSLREDSRQKLTYFARSGLVLVILFFLFTIQGSMGWANAPGLRFFSTVIGIDLCFVILAGVSYFSAAISEEKEEMTLGLLRMTNLNPLSILLGKSTSRLCTAVLLFAAQIPFTMLAITLGGISLRQILAAYVAVGAFLVLVSNLALLASVICRRTSAAAVLTGATLFWFFAIVPLAGWLAQLPVQLGLLTSSSGWVESLKMFAKFAGDASPFLRLDKIFRTGFQDPAFTFQVWSNLALGAGFFLLAWVLFERFCGEQKESAPSRGGLTRARGRRRLFSPGRPWARALAWKDYYFLSGGKLWLVLKFLIYGAPLLVARCWPQKLGGPPPWDDFGVGVFWLMAAFIGVELTFAAGSIFRVERQGQTLSSLAMLPQGIRRVAYEKLLGIVPALAAAGIYLAVSLPLISGIIGEIWHDISWESNDLWGLVALGCAVAQGLFFLHLVANLSLRVKRGALPLAVGIHFLLMVFGGITTSSMFRDESGLVLAFCLTLGATIFLHLNIGHRLVQLSAEE